MAYHCIKGYKDECDGCGECNDNRTPICPVCGEEVYESVYKNTEGDVIGCENCVEKWGPEELLEYED
jgi:hypothetical protein